MDRIVEEEKFNVLKYRIDRIIQDGGSDDPKQDMLYVAEYYQYLSDNLNPEEYLIDASKELILSFESLYLWLSEKLSHLSNSIGNQIEEIFKTKNLCEIFAILASLSPSDIRRINRNRSLGILGSLLGSKISLNINEQQAELISSRNIYDTKIALVRLSQVVKFASSKVNDISLGSSTFEEFKSSYNPDLINKAKVSALIGILKSQIADLPQDENTELLLKKLNEVEIEVKKNMPHWGLVFSTLFVIFGFTADLKTLNTDIYDKPLQTVQAILLCIHEEGKVETNKTSLRLLGDSSQDKPEKKEENFVFRRKEDEGDVEEQT